MKHVRTKHTAMPQWSFAYPLLNRLLLQKSENEENVPRAPAKRKHVQAFGPHAGLELRASDREAAEPEMKKINTETDEDCAERMEIIAAVGCVGLHLKDQKAWNTSFMNTPKCQKAVREAAQAEFEKLCAEQDKITSNIKQKRALALANNDSWNAASTQGIGTVKREPNFDPVAQAAADLQEARKASELLSRQAATKEHLQQVGRKKKVEVIDIETGATTTIEESAVASADRAGTNRGSDPQVDVAQDVVTTPEGAVPLKTMQGSMPTSLFFEARQSIKVLNWQTLIVDSTHLS